MFQWMLYTYDGGELVILSKPFKTKEEAEKSVKLFRQYWSSGQ